jgi:acylphosphatase
MMLRTARVVVRGTVQGVWYRGWTVATAERMGVAGWVRNRRDGSVEAMLQGEPAVVDEMIAACRRGPPAARVASVDVEEATPEPLTGFTQRPTE